MCVCGIGWMKAVFSGWSVVGSGVCVVVGRGREYVVDVCLCLVSMQ